MSSTQPSADFHASEWIEDFAAGRLESPLADLVEAHLLVCDSCFADYVALVLHAV